MISLAAAWWRRTRPRCKRLEGSWEIRLLSDLLQSARLSGVSSWSEKVAKFNVIPDLSALDPGPVPEIGSKQLPGLLDDIRRRLIIMSDGNRSSAVSVFTLVLVASSPSSVLHTVS